MALGHSFTRLLIASNIMLLCFLSVEFAGRWASKVSLLPTELSYSALPTGEVPTTTTSSSSTTNNIMMYPSDPQRLVQVLVDCLELPSCHLLYHHVPKTGGTDIAFRLHPIFERGARYRSQEWCCYEGFLEKFRENPQHYCLKRKMNILEVWGSEYDEVVRTCQELGTPLSHTYVSWISIREPITRTVSLIHQQCNSGYETKNEKYQAYCRQCTYDETTESFWSKFTNETNRAYREVLSFVQDQKRSASSSSSNNNGMPILVVDTSMLSDFFAQWDSLLDARGHSSPNFQGTLNSESRAICDFPMKSSMMKALRPALASYLDLWRVDV